MPPKEPEDYNTNENEMIRKNEKAYSENDEKIISCIDFENSQLELEKWMLSKNL